MGIPEMVAKGKRNYKGKLDSMKKNYADSVAGAVEEFRGIGFGPQMTQRYEDGMRNAAENYRAAMTSDKVEKWARKWERAGSR